MTFDAISSVFHKSLEIVFERCERYILFAPALQVDLI